MDKLYFMIEIKGMTQYNGLNEQEKDKILCKVRDFIAVDHKLCFLKTSKGLVGNKLNVQQ